MMRRSILPMSVLLVALVVLIAALGLFRSSPAVSPSDVTERLRIGQHYEEVVASLQLDSRQGQLHPEPGGAGYYCKVSVPSWAGQLSGQPTIFLSFTPGKRLEGAWQKVESLFTDTSADIPLGPPR